MDDKKPKAKPKRKAAPKRKPAAKKTTLTKASAKKPAPPISEPETKATETRPTFEAGGNTFYLSPEGHVYDADERVAMRWYQPGQYMIQTGDGDSYVFITKNDIALAWIKPEHVGQVLAKKAGCCNNKRQAASYTDQTHVRRWYDGGR